MSKWLGSGVRLTQRIGSLTQRLSLLLTRGELVGRDALGNQYFRKMEWDPDLGELERNGLPPPRSPLPDPLSLFLSPSLSLTSGVEKEQRWMKSPRGHNHAYNYDPGR